MAAVTSPLPAAPPSDDALLVRFAAGDRDALDELFRRHRGLAYQVAYRLLGHEADALDAVQDGFVKVLAHLGQFQGRSSFKTWLLRVVSNAALDLGRSRGRRELISLDAAATEGETEARLPVRTEDPTANAEQADLRARLDAALAELSEAQRRTFVLHVDGGLSYKEVADALGISIGTVMSRLYYARQKLRGRLADYLT